MQTRGALSCFRTPHDITILNGNVAFTVKLHRFSKKIKVNSRAYRTNHCHFGMAAPQALALSALHFVLNHSQNKYLLTTAKFQALW